MQCSAAQYLEETDDDATQRLEARDDAQCAQRTQRPQRADGARVAAARGDEDGVAYKHLRAWVRWGV